MDKFFDASPDALAPRKQAGFVAKYPWRELPEGKSFHVNHEDAKYESLCVLANRTGKRLKRRFRVINHGAQGMEVARLPDVLPEMIFTTPVAEVNVKPIIPNDSPWKVKE